MRKITRLRIDFEPMREFGLNPYQDMLLSCQVDLQTQEGTYPEKYFNQQIIAQDDTESHIDQIFEHAKREFKRIMAIDSNSEAKKLLDRAKDLL